tara:strand:- start:422 stop:952 length:531 start_codon:yes stop_codon:yes gene_type:complete
MFSFGVLYGTLGTPMGIIVFVRRSPARPPRDEVFIDFHARSANVSHLARPSPRRNAPANLFPFTNPPYAPTRIVDADADADVPRAPLEGRRDRSRRDDAVPFAPFKTTRAPTPCVNMTTDAIESTSRVARRVVVSPRDARRARGRRSEPSPSGLYRSTRTWSYRIREYERPRGCPV